jgi:hypothetical protein
MLQSLTRIFDYIGYLFGATDLHGIHSPFIYSLAETVLYNKLDKRIESVEFQRTQMLKSKGQFLDQPLALFVDAYTLPSKHAFALGQLVDYLDIRNITEYGKTTGIETNYALYFPLIQKNVPIEYRYIFPNDNSVKVKTNELWLKNYPNEMGNIKWDPSISKVNDWELHVVHLSENSEEIWQFWEQQSKKFHNNTIVVITNIRHSDDHYLKWKQVSNDVQVTVDIDLFRMGILFFRKEQPKESFLLRY